MLLSELKMTDIRKEKKNQDTFRCSPNFLMLIKDYQKAFEDKYKVKPSITEITEIIATKIKNVGGLKV